MSNKKIEIFNIDINDVDIHKIADMNPMQSEDDFLALKYSIEQIGQLEPVLMFKGRLVDGRNRLKALKELCAESSSEKYKSINYKKLPTTLSMEELEEIVIGKETRRHKTSVQKAIQALNYYEAKNKTDKDLSMRKVAKKFGITHSPISKILSLRKIAGDAVVQKLFSGGSVPIKKSKRDGTIYTVKSTSPDAIRKYYESMLKDDDTLIYSIDVFQLSYIQLKVTELLDVLSCDGITHLSKLLEKNKDVLKTSYNKEIIQNYLNS